LQLQTKHKLQKTADNRNINNYPTASYSNQQNSASQVRNADNWNRKQLQNINALRLN